MTLGLSAVQCEIHYNVICSHGRPFLNEHLLVIFSQLICYIVNLVPLGFLQSHKKIIAKLRLNIVLFVAINFGKNKYIEINITLLLEETNVHEGGN